VTGGSDVADIKSYPISQEFLTCTTLWLRSYKKHFSEHSLVGLSQFMALDYITASSDGRLSKQIANEFNLNPSTITKIIDNLEFQGLIMRKADPSDRRIIIIVATPEARAIVESCHDAMKAVSKKMEAPLGGFLKQVATSEAGYSDAIKADGSDASGAPRGLEFYRVCMLCDTRLRELLRKEGLNLTEYRILFELTDQPSGMHTTALASNLLLYTPDVTTACNHLDKKKLILRSNDPVDRRAIFVEITSDGFARFKEVQPKVERLFSDFAQSFFPQASEYYHKVSHLIVTAQRKSFRA
jgi:DNA-binding MarR family transcriptional regulator